MADGLQRSSESALNSARRKASPCPSGSRAHIRHSYNMPEDSGSDGEPGDDGEPAP